MQIVLHVVFTALSLLLVAKVLQGFEVSNLFTALVAAVIIGLITAFMCPFAEYLGRVIGSFSVTLGISYPAKLAVLIVSTLLLNALVLQLTAAFGPGIRINGFMTAMLAALLLAVFNAVIGEAYDFAVTNFTVPPADRASVSGLRTVQEFLSMV